MKTLLKVTSMTDFQLTTLMIVIIGLIPQTTHLTSSFLMKTMMTVGTFKKTIHYHQPLIQTTWDLLTTPLNEI